MITSRTRSPALNQARRIVWSVNPFELSPRQLAQGRTFLARLRRDHAIDVELVYVLTPGELNLSPDYYGPWMDELLPTAQKALERLAHSLGEEIAARPTVLRKSVGSQRKSVMAVVDYAVANDADLIVVGTHARSGLSRVLLGSFAEQLLTESRIPVVVLPPGTSALDQVPAASRILHATDFGPGAKRTFRDVVEMAAAYGQPVTLFHSVPHPVQPIVQSGAYLLGGAWLPPPVYFADDDSHARRRAEAWAAWARNRGVEVTVRIDTAGTNVADAIIDLAEAERAALIAMESHSGRVSAALVGSLARLVLRHAPCPVLTFHPARAARAEATAPQRHAA